MSISGTGGASAGGQMSIGGTDELRSSSAGIKNENVPKTTQELGSLTVYGKQNPCNCARYLGSGFGG